MKKEKMLMPTTDFAAEMETLRIQRQQWKLIAEKSAQKCRELEAVVKKLKSKKPTKKKRKK